MKINLLKSAVICAICGLLFGGCGKSIKPLSPVSVAPITVIGSNVTKAKTSAQETVTAAKSGDMKKTIEKAIDTQAILEVTEKQVEYYKSEIVQKNTEIDKHNEQVSQLQIERDRYKAAMWKRNWIILGLIGGYVLIVLLFVFKQALRNNPWTGWIVRLLLG